MFTFRDNSVWLNFLLFALAAAGIWFAGTRLERYADAIARRTGMGHAFVGLLLLAAATSLPEVAATLTAVLIGNTSLAVHNLLGGVVLQTGVLALADVVGGPRAITHRTPRHVLIIEGLGVVFLLAIVLVGGSLGKSVEPSLQGTAGWLAGGLWGCVLLLAFLLVLYTVHVRQGHPRWQPTAGDDDSPESGPADGPQDGAGAQGRAEAGARRLENWSGARLGFAFATGSLVVLVAGWLVAHTGDALAHQTGMGASFVGATLMALATSLPEISTTTAAVRAGNDEMAISNILGSNAFDVTLLAAVALFAGAPALLEAGTASAAFAAALGILVTCVYLWGMLERRDRTVLRMGWDSAIVLVLVLAGNALMYFLE